MIWLLVLFVHTAHPWQITREIYADKAECQAAVERFNAIDPMLEERCEPMDLSRADV